MYEVSEEKQDDIIAEVTDSNIKAGAEPHSQHIIKFLLDSSFSQTQ